MRLWFKRWKPSQLLLAWSAYWVGLVLVKLGPALVAGWHISQQVHGHGSANANIGDGILSANIVDGGRTVWTGSISVLTLALLIAVPPLLIWLVWLAGSSRTKHADEIAAGSRNTKRELSAAEPRIGTIETSTSTSTRRAREES
jgi:hypothetical protein